MGFLKNKTEYYSVVKKDKLETFIAEWMHLEDTLLSEINRTHVNTKLFLWCEKLNG